MNLFLFKHLHLFCHISVRFSEFEPETYFLSSEGFGVTVSTINALDLGDISAV